MKLNRFLVKNYRNVNDSDWIDVNQVTAFVGQNEAGKSNLFEALYHVNPMMEGDKYNIDEDWPVDDWGNKNKQAIVCTVQYTLDSDEIADLYKQAYRSPQENKKSEESLDKQEAPQPKLPRTIILEAQRGYSNVTSFCIVGKGQEDLDPSIVQQWAKSNVLKFVYIHEYDMSGSQIELDQLKKRRDTTKWENLSNEDQTILIILDLAKIDLNSFIEKGQSAEGRTIRSFDKKSASTYLSNQFKNLWRQKDVRFDIDVDGTTLNIFVEDSGIGMPVRLNRRSTGFRWYVSFAWKFTHASNGQYKNCILLLEEPGIHLHYDGQRDLLNVFEELSEKNTILYSTHLASMVNLAFPERIRIVESKNNHAVVKTGVVSSQKAPMAVIEVCLGLTGSMSGLLSNRQSLIVEGGDDALILQKLSGLMKISNKTGLSDLIYLWPAKGAPQTPMYAAFAIGNKWDAGVLLDTDLAGNEAKKKIDELYLSKMSEQDRKKFRVLQIGKSAGISKTDAAIEDLFPDDFYVECVNTAYGLAIKKENLSSDGSDMITKRIESFLIANHGYKELDKRRIMNVMLKEFDTWKSADDLPQGTAKKAEKLFKTLNEAFEVSISPELLPLK